MEFLQLTYFQHAAKTENFSHTADAFLVPPSSVSSSIKKLEQELGVLLFDRSANRITLNENGKLFLSCVEQIFSTLEQTKNQFLETDGDLSGKIRILIITNRRIITQIISEFHERYPKVSFILDFDEGKNQKEYDIIVTDRIIKRPDFEEHDFLREEICLAVPPNHALSSKNQVNMPDLSQEKFICLHPNHSLRTITDALCKEALFTPDIAIECDDTFYIREYLKMGMGISIVPIISWKEQLDPSISLLRINDGVWRHSKIYTGKNASRSVQIFMDYLNAFPR